MYPEDPWNAVGDRATTRTLALRQQYAGNPVALQQALYRMEQQMFGRGVGAPPPSGTPEQIAAAIATHYNLYNTTPNGVQYRAVDPRWLRQVLVSMGFTDQAALDGILASPAFRTFSPSPAQPSAGQAGALQFSLPQEASNPYGPNPYASATYVPPAASTPDVSHGDDSVAPQRGLALAPAPAATADAGQSRLPGSR